MFKVLTTWDNTESPFIAVENHEVDRISAFWGAIIPSIPDLVSIEQNRTGMSYETALKTLLNAQRQWIQQLYGDEKFSLSLRIIAESPTLDVTFGLVAKAIGKERSKVIRSARHFYNKVRDTFPNGYSLQACDDFEKLAKLRLPFLPESFENNPKSKSYAEFRRNLTRLSTISDPSIPGEVGFEIDPWISQGGTFQSLFRALVCHSVPVAIAINLKATTLTQRESNYLAEQARLYANIASVSKSTSSQNRVHSQSLQYQEKLVEAEQASEAWKQLRSHWRSPFEMSINILAVSEIPQSLIAALQSEVDANPAQADNRFEVRSGGGHIIFAESEAQKIAVRQNWADLTLHRWGNTYNLDRLPWLFSPEEVHCLFRLPIADRHGVWGLPSAPGGNDARRPQLSEKNQAEIKLGTLSLTKRQLTQHLLICGVPGGGKTNTALSLLENLWNQHQIPWLVLEPAKTEYRGLLTVPSLKSDLIVFTLGDERIAPFRFNPFELPKGINLDSHMGALLDIFSVSMSMWGPLPSVLEQIIQEAYKRKGFTSLGNNGELCPPRFSDLAALVKEIVPKLGYKKETTDEISAALSVRFNKFCRGLLGNMLDTYQSAPFDVLMKQPVILEISQITNTDDRAFIMALILNRCYEYWISRRHEATGELKHLLLIEEAHNLLGKVTEAASQEQANPKGKAVRNFANMLAEVRGFGQGIAISEQNPDGLITDIMVNTNIKIAHRVVEANNREALERSMLLTPQQSRSLASLKVGQALFYLGGTPEPGLAAIPNFKDAQERQYNSCVADAMVQQHFKIFRTKYAGIYTPLFGCPTDPELAFCIEIGQDLALSLIEDSNKETIFLQILAAPFGAPSIALIMPALGKRIRNTHIHSLTEKQIEAIVDSSISFLAWAIVQEKGKLHGWPGYQLLQAHELLIQSLYDLVFKEPSAWMYLCSIPKSLLDLGLSIPEYKLLETPGIFRYEAKLILTYKSEFLKYLDQSSESPSKALLTWLADKFPYYYQYLSSALLKSFFLDVSIELTIEKPSLLQEFLDFNVLRGTVTKSL